MKVRERIAVGVVSILIAIPLMLVKSGQWVEGYLDTAGLSQLVENIATGKEPGTQVVAGVAAFYERNIPWLSVQEICQSEYLFSVSTLNSFQLRFWHAYWFAYVLALLSWVIPIDVLFPSLVVLSYLILIILTYFFLRGKGIPVVGSVLFCLLVMIHPSWSEGLRSGQIYFDRFFLLFGSLFLYTFITKRPNQWLLVLFGIMNALIVERVGLIIGVFVIGYTILNWRERAWTWRIALALGVSLLLYSFIMLFVFLQGTTYTSFIPLTIADWKLNLNYPGYIRNMGIFLIMNFALMAFALFKPKGLMLAFVTMLPNIIGNIGGAEKTGWSIHYHVLYLPFLVWAAADGYAWLLLKLRTSETLFRFQINDGWKKISTGVLYALLLGLILVFGGVDPYTPRIDTYRLSRFNEQAIISMINRVSDYWPEENLHITHTVYEQLQNTIPSGSVVSATEGVFPALYRQRTVWLFPIGIDSADFVINPSGDFSYLSESNRNVINACLSNRMNAEGFDIDNPLIIGNNIIYQRKNNTSDVSP